MTKWQKIWNKKDRVESIILETLIKADGFDVGAGSFKLDDWLNYTKKLFETLNLKDDDSIYEVGCGSGAFLYPLYINSFKVSGLDYSSILIELANTFMKDCSFKNDEAINLDTKEKFDILISHGVFHYFEDQAYAKEVIKKMIEKANKKIAIFDINDKAKEDIYHQIRMQGLSKEEYEKKYEGLDHLFYEKSWFEDLAKEFGLKIEIFDQDFDAYLNSKLRFNVIMEKI